MTTSYPRKDEWQRHWRSAAEDLTRLSVWDGSQRADVTIQRSSQADASRLDQELTSILREQFLRIFRLFNPGIYQGLQPELTALLDFLIFRYSVWEGRPLPGMALMNLRFRNEASRKSALESAFGGRTGVEGPGLSYRQRALYCLGAVVLRYVWARANTYVASGYWSDGQNGVWAPRVWYALRGTEAVFSIASLVNALIFLRTGRYRALLERAIGARLVYNEVSASRAISYEYLNRQLVWAEVSEVLLFLLPLVDARAVKRAIRAALPRLPVLGKGEASTKVDLSAREGCAICGSAEVNVPYEALPCAHVFCYYCVRSHTLTDPEFCCPLCLERVVAVQPCYRPSGKRQ